MAEIILWAAIGYLIGLAVNRKTTKKPEHKAHEDRDGVLYMLVNANNNHQAAIVEIARQLNSHTEAIEALSNRPDKTLTTETYH